VAKDPFLVAIDIGSSAIKLAVAKDSLDEQDKIQILALVERTSNGIKRGVVTNMSEATESLVDVIDQAETVIGLPIREAVFGVNGISISFTNSEGLIVISGADSEITETDIDRVIQDSLGKAFGINNNEIIHVIPKSFTVDNQSGIRYPVGMIGSKLDAKTLIVSAENSYLRNFTKVINQANIDLTDQIFTPLASSDFILTMRQKKAGTVLIDIGASSTSFIVWENEEIFTTGIIPIGSDHITADLAVGLQTTMEMAEELKKQHLDLSPNFESDVDEVEMYNPDLQINETFRLSELRTYARARVEEIFAYINKELKSVGKSTQLPGGAVLIGGGSALKGIDEIAKKVMKIPIFKYVFDKNKIEFVPDYNDDPAFINSISLAAYYLYHSEEISYNRPSGKSHPGNKGNSGGSNNLKGVFKKIWPFG
jgi:cell division protein FtsA